MVAVIIVLVVGAIVLSRRPRDRVLWHPDAPNDHGASSYHGAAVAKNPAAKGSLNRMPALYEVPSLAEPIHPAPHGYVNPGTVGMPYPDAGGGMSQGDHEYAYITSAPVYDRAVPRASTIS